MDEQDAQDLNNPWLTPLPAKPPSFHDSLIPHWRPWEIAA